MSASRPVLRATLGLGGIVASAAGAHTAITGARSLPSRAAASAEIESELSFYAVFYVAYGTALLSAAADPIRAERSLPGFAAALFCAGLARAGAWARVGAPHPAQRALLAIELAGPPVALLAERFHRR